VSGSRREDADDVHALELVVLRKLLRIELRDGRRHHIGLVGDQGKLGHLDQVETSGREPGDEHDHVGQAVANHIELRRYGADHLGQDLELDATLRDLLHLGHPGHEDL